jgi:glutamyl/glutaminyl-tRNA synthetase
LLKFRRRLEALDPFDAGTIEKELQAFVQTEGIAHAQVIHALRIAATGKTVGFGLFESLAILGKPECLSRIDRALARLA